ncbi:hypothetical protein JW921_01150 [Candidatus Fermentibacterales bacterium]|nr:hypothetical protein [Candidatus Fermentibacterales bacterium]
MTGGSAAGAPAVALALCLVLSQASMAAGPGGGGSDTGEGSVTAYVVVGLVVALGVLFTLDILSDNGSSAEEEAVRDPDVSSLVDWDRVASETDPDAAAVTTSMAVVTLGESDARESAAVLLARLRAALPSTFELFPEPVDLGGVSLAEAASLSRDFYGCENILAIIPSASGGCALLMVSTRDGQPVWSDTLSESDPDSLAAAADRLGDFLR